MNEIKIDPIVPETGNTNLSPKKQISPSKKWCFTLNNYNSSNIIVLTETFKEKANKYVFEEECGEGGTPHLQGYVEFTTKIRPTSLGCVFKKAHWEKTRGTQIENILYCSKNHREDPGKYRLWKKNVMIPKEVRVIKPYGWQTHLLDLINNYDNDRLINWWWEPKGGVGKTEFCRFLAKEKNAIIVGGSSSDMKYAVMKYKEINGCGPELIVFDVPRCSEDYISYKGIEEVKNALFFSTKYESCQYVDNPPFVLVFANFPPDKDRLSGDRWTGSIIRIQTN